MAAETSGTAADGPRAMLMPVVVNTVTGGLVLIGRVPA